MTPTERKRAQIARYKEQGRTAALLLYVYPETRDQIRAYAEKLQRKAERDVARSPA